MGEPLFFFAGGGTGGHLFPGLAVADALVQRCPNARIVFWTTDRPLDEQLLHGRPYGRRVQPVRPFSPHPLQWPRFWWAWRQSIAAASRSFRSERPAAVLGLGGYAAGPAVVAAARRGIPTAILNPDAIPGRANRYLAGIAGLVVLQWEVSRSHFPPSVHTEVLGCPIRAEFAGADPAAGRRRFGLASDRPVLLVTGASQGAHTINEALWRVWPAFHRTHPDWQLLHLSGPADEAPTRAAYQTADVPACTAAFSDEMWLALAAADLVISRAGASTLAELAVLGKPAVLLPYPYHRDRHQHANAQVLVEAGAAVLVEDQRDAEANAGRLRPVLESLADSGVRRRMAVAAGNLGRPAAAAAVAGRLLDLGGRL